LAAQNCSAAPLPVGSIAYLNDPYSPPLLCDSIESYTLFFGAIQSGDKEAFDDLMHQGKIRSIGNGAKVQVTGYGSDPAVTKGGVPIKLYRVRLVGEGFTDQEFWVIEQEVVTSPNSADPRR